MKLWHFLNSLMCLNVHMKVLTLLLYKEDFLKRLCVITSVWFNAWETENYFFILYWHTFIIFKGDSSIERKRGTNKIVWWKWWRSLSETEVTIYWICEIHLCKLWLFKIDNFLFCWQTKINNLSAGELRCLLQRLTRYALRIMEGVKWITSVYCRYCNSRMLLGMSYTFNLWVSRNPLSFFKLN